MAFPFTHLCVAWRILEKNPLPEAEAAQFLLGSVAPDAVHYRAGFSGAKMKGIGAAKKVTHLCPVSDELWGQVTDNAGWGEIVKDFIRVHPGDAFAAGYAAHVLTDSHNNQTIWDKFRTNFPEEAAKGYDIEYYADLQEIHTRLYLEFPATAQIMDLLAKAVPAGLPGLVSAEEVHALQQNLLHEAFKDAAPPATPRRYHFVTYEDTLKFIETATEFCMEVSEAV